ncbi:MAG: hypothetical protein QRY74_05460 [Chlamydia sp.]
MEFDRKKKYNSNKHRRPTFVWKGMLSDGSESRYERNFDYFEDFLRLQEVKKPSRNYVTYHYSKDAFQLQKRVESKSFNKKEIFGSLDFKKGKREISVSSTNGKRSVYKLHEAKNHKNEDKEHFLHEIDSPDQPQTWFYLLKRAKS